MGFYPMILYSHPTGNANVRQSLQALAEEGMLAEFWTCINWNPEAAWTRFMPESLQRQFARRTFPAIARGRLRTSPWREAGRLFAPKLKLNYLTRHEVGPLSVDAVFHALDHRVAARLSQISGITGVYASEDGACEIFRQAKRMGLPRFYDLPTGYWKAGLEIYAEEKERQPQWASTLTGTQNSIAKFARKDEELALSDVVFVASSFTRKTLEFAPWFPGQIYVVPYGAPPVSETPNLENATSPLKLLYVGSLTQGKGLSYLLEAVNKLHGHVELTIIGKKPNAACAPLEEALRRHRWVGSLPHQNILAEMSRHDLLLFPSLFDGFGLVILEAMSQGMPVIATPNSGGPDVITDGRDGFIVPIRSADAIAEKICLLLTQPDLLSEMKMAAWETAKQRTWETYRRTLVQSFREELMSNR